MYSLGAVDESNMCVGFSSHAFRAGERAQGLIALAARARDLSFILGTHIMAYNYLQVQFPVIQYSFVAISGTRDTCSAHVYMQTHTQNSNKVIY